MALSLHLTLCIFTLQTFTHGLFAQRLKSVSNGTMAQKNILFYEKYNGAVMFRTQQAVSLQSLSTQWRQRASLRAVREGQG